MGRLSKATPVVLLIGSVLLLYACSTTSQQTASNSQACDDQVTPMVAIDLPHNEPVEDRSLDIAALSAMDSADKNVPALQNYKATLGTTAVTVKAHLDGDLRADPRGSHWCAKLIRATVKLTLDTKVYVARELVPGSCPERAVREHEAKHVALDRELLPSLKEAIELSVRRATEHPTWGSYADGAMSSLKANIQRAADDTIEEFGKQRDARQLTIDTPEEYDRVAASCGPNAFPKVRGKATTGM